ncbi:MAG: ParA family protein [Planctomycetota bacterium]
MILALINNRGGVAKTTTSVSLAGALAGENQRVLLVDMDSQAAASLSLGLRRAELKPSIADVLLHNEPIRNVIRKTRVTGLDLIVGSNELAGADVAMASMLAREAKLKKAFDIILDDYASIIIDCPPSLSLLSINALLAADYYIVPVTLQYLTLGGLASLVQEVNSLCDCHSGSVAHLMGFVLTMVDYRNRTTANLINSVRANWKDNIFKTEVRVNVKLAEAPTYGQTIFEYAPKSTGAKSYLQLAKEVVQRWNSARVEEDEEVSVATQPSPPQEALTAIKPEMITLQSSSA